MGRQTIKERAKELIDNLSTDQAKVILDLLERFNEKEEAIQRGEHTPNKFWRYKIILTRRIILLLEFWNRQNRAKSRFYAD